MKLHIAVGVSIMAWILLANGPAFNYEVVTSLAITTLAIVFALVVKSIYPFRVHRNAYIIYALAYALMPLTYLPIRPTPVPLGVLPMVYLVATFLLLIDGVFRSRYVSTAAIEVADLTERTVDAHEGGS